MPEDVVLGEREEKTDREVSPATQTKESLRVWEGKAIGWF